MFELIKLIPSLGAAIVTVLDSGCYCSSSSNIGVQTKCTNKAPWLMHYLLGAHPADDTQSHTLEQVAQSTAFLLHATH